jgi:hypothetical protein
MRTVFLILALMYLTGSWSALPSGGGGGKGSPPAPCQDGPRSQGCQPPPPELVLR